MKINKKVIVIISITLILLMLSYYSFSKLYIQNTGSGLGEIARWSFKTENREIFLKDLTNEIGLANEKIAPGTKGNFDLVIDATGSEVSVDYEVNVLSETSLPENMKYYVKRENNYMSSKYSSLHELAQTELKGNIPINGNQKIVITINWEWPYETEDFLETEEYDNSDWEYGTKADLEYKFVLQIVGTQSKTILSNSKPYIVESNSSLLRRMIMPALAES